MSEAGPPPGWYPDGGGDTRWWDGQRWSEHTAGAAAPPGMQQATGPAATPGSRIDVGAALSWAMRAFGEHWQVLVAMMLILGAASLAGVLLSFLVLLPAMSTGSGTAAVLVSWVVFVVVIVGTYAVLFVLQAGLLRAALAMTAGQPPALGMLVSGHHLGTFVGTVLLVSLATAVGYVLCILPGLVVLVFCAFAPLLALDRGVGPVEAMRGSIEMVRANLGEVLVLLIAAGGVYYVGSLVCYVGLLVSAPVAVLMVAAGYRSIAPPAPADWAPPAG